MTDWGAHMFDVAQWALGKDRNGPVEIIPPGHSYYDHLTYLYDNGVVMTEEPFDGTKQGVKFYGDNGWIQVCRGEVLASDPVFLPDTRTKNDDLPYETRIPHQINFIESVRSRRCRSKSDTAHARSATSVTSHTNWGAPSNGTPSSRNSWTTRTQPHCCITPTATAIRWKADIRTAAPRMGADECAARSGTRPRAAQHARLGARAEARPPRLHDGAPLRRRGARRVDKGQRAGRPARHRLRTYNQGAVTLRGEVRLPQHPPLEAARVPRLRAAPARARTPRSQYSASTREWTPVRYSRSRSLR